MEKELIQYSEKYNDDKYEYRHVTLPKEIAKQLPRDKLMSEYQWRKIGVQQSRGWEHYMIHSPGIYFVNREPHILLFRRPLPNNHQQDTNQEARVCANGTNA